MQLYPSNKISPANQVTELRQFLQHKQWIFACAFVRLTHSLTCSNMNFEKCVVIGSLSSAFKPYSTSRNVSESESFLKNDNINQHVNSSACFTALEQNESSNFGVQQFNYEAKQNIYFSTPGIHVKGYTLHSFLAFSIVFFSFQIIFNFISD